MTFYRPSDPLNLLRASMGLGQWLLPLFLGLWLRPFLDQAYHLLRDCYLGTTDLLGGLFQGIVTPLQSAWSTLSQFFHLSAST